VASARSEWQAFEGQTDGVECSDGPSSRSPKPPHTHRGEQLRLFHPGLADAQVSNPEIEKCSRLSTCYKNGQYVDCVFGDKICYWSCGTSPACFFEHLGGIALCTAIGISTATPALGAACSVISAIPSWPNCGSPQSCGCFCEVARCRGNPLHCGGGP
jgi:hypothetical protein